MLQNGLKHLRLHAFRAINVYIKTSKRKENKMNEELKIDKELVEKFYNFLSNTELTEERLEIQNQLLNLK